MQEPGLPQGVSGRRGTRAGRAEPRLQPVRLLAIQCLLAKPLNSEALAMITQELHTVVRAATFR